MSENVNINVQQDNDIVNIASSQITEVVDVNVYETIEDVTLNITEEIIQININKVTSSGTQTLAETLNIGNNTEGNDILLNNSDAIALENGSSLEKGTYNFGGNGGISRICSNNYEDNWQNGFRHVFDQSGFIRNSSNCFNIIPDISFDVTLKFKVGSIWTLDDGTNYICTDATEGAAVWELYTNGLVPYTGANDNVDLGTNDLYTKKVFLFDEVADNHASIHYADGDLHIEDADGHKLLVIEDGFMQLHLSDTIQSNLFTTLLTETRNHYLPNADGTIALTSDITGTNSGTNTGDETATTIKNKLGITTLSGSNTGDQDLSGKVDKVTGKSLISDTEITRLAGVTNFDNSANVTALNGKVDKVTGQRLITSGEATILSNTSNTNTGDETTATIKSKLGITTLSGSNTGDETQNTILSKLGYYNYKNTTSSSTLTGSLTETQLLQVTIPANTFSASDFLKFTAMFVKAGVAGTCIVRFKLSTSATMPSGATSTFAFYSIGATSLFAQVDRRAAIKGGNITGFPNSASAATDSAASTVTISSQAFDLTVTNYFYVSAALGSTADSIYMNSIQISNI